MRIIFTILFCLLSYSVLLSQHTLTINVYGIKNEQGVIKLAIYDAKEDFAIEGKQIMGQLAKPNKKGVQFTIKDLEPGKYAIAVYHDVNKNGVLDKNLLGIPTEGFGFSSNKNKSKFGPPKWEDSVMSIPKTKEITITFYSK